MLKVNLEYRKGVLFVRLNGNLNMFSKSKINKYLISVINRHGIKYLVYNFDELVKIDKSGLKALISSVDAIKYNNGCVYMCNNHFKLEINDIERIDNELVVFNKVVI